MHYQRNARVIVLHYPIVIRAPAFRDRKYAVPALIGRRLDRSRSRPGTMDAARINAGYSRDSNGTIKPPSNDRENSSERSERRAVELVRQDEEGSTGYRVSVHRASALTADRAETFTATPPS